MSVENHHCIVILNIVFLLFFRYDLMTALCVEGRFDGSTIWNST